MLCVELDKEGRTIKLSGTATVKAIREYGLIKACIGDIDANN